MPVAVTVRPVPTLALAKVAEPAEQVTLAESAARTPVRVQALIVAVLLPSYVLLAAVTLAVTDTGVILAVVVAVVDASVYLDAADPLSEIPVAVTVMPLPTLALANDAEAAEQLTLPASAGSTPLKLQATVADADPS